MILAVIGWTIICLWIGGLAGWLACAHFTAAKIADLEERCAGLDALVDAEAAP